MAMGKYTLKGEGAEGEAMEDGHARTVLKYFVFVAGDFKAFAPLLHPDNRHVRQPNLIRGSEYLGHDGLINSQQRLTILLMGIKG